MGTRLTLKLLAACAALASAGAGNAQTQSDGKEMSVTGYAPLVCTLQEGRIQAGSLVNIAGTDGRTLQIQQFVDPQTLSARAASATIEFDAVCNFPHTVRIESQNNGLWPTDGRVSSVPTRFAYAVPYSATVVWGNYSTSLQANAKVRQIAQSSVAVDSGTEGTLRLHIEVAEGASNVENKAPVLAGDYADTVRIFLEPR